jgi:hypothetical protein
VAKQSVTNIISVTVMNLVPSKAGAMCELLFNRTASGWLLSSVTRKLNKISPNFWRKWKKYQNSYIKA